MRVLIVVATVAMLSLGVSGCLTDAGPAKSSEGSTKRLGGATAQSPAVFPGPYKFDGQFSQTLVEGIYKALPMQEVRLKSQIDGVDIQFAMWRPDTPDGVKAPIVIQASPYYGDTKQVSSIGHFIMANFVPHGYAYVQLAVRSTGDSGGCDDFRGPKMTADMSQAITWLAEQPWSNGNVTLIGISYVGTTPWYAAGSGNPAIKTIVPISGSTNAWEVYNRNGSSEGRSPAIIPNYGTSAAANPNRSPEKKVENFTCLSGDVHRAWAAGVYSGVMGDKEPFRDFWDARNVKPIVEKNYKGSVLVVHGFEDWNVDPAPVFPWVRELNRTFGLPVKTLVGQWGHTYPDTAARAGGSIDWKNPMVRADWAEILLRWFDYWLKGQTVVDTGPWVQLQDNAKRWRNEDYYPPIDATWSKYHLASGNRLAEAPGTAGSMRLLPTSLDNQFVRSTPGGLAYLFADFTLGPLEKDLHISGLPRVHVTVTPQGPGGYVGAWLLDVDVEKGTSKRIGWTSMNLKFADGTDQSRPVVPGQPLMAKMEIQPMDAVVPAGHTLALRIWVNPHADRTPSIPPTIVDLNYGGTVTSVLELPSIDRPAEWFFEPPRP